MPKRQTDTSSGYNKKEKKMLFSTSEFLKTKINIGDKSA